MNNTEIWKDVPGYEGIYQVSDMGNVKSLSREKLIRGKYPITTKEKILKQLVNPRGYLIVILCKNNLKKTINVHMLVAMAFLNHKSDGTYKIVIDHINNNKLDNRVVNLQLISQRENSSKDKKDGTSQYVGVSWNKSRNKWVVFIKIDNKNKNLGYFIDEYLAHLEYEKALKMYHEGDLSFMKTKKYSSKYKGVSWHKTKNKWEVKIKVDGKQKYLGTFTDEYEAHLAYQKALKMYHEGDLSFMKPKEFSCKYKGVCWNKQSNKWKSVIYIDGKQKYLGLFIDEYEAHLAYKKALNEYKNKFAH
jgi:hypothetical protein